MQTSYVARCGGVGSNTHPRQKKAPQRNQAGGNQEQGPIWITRDKRNKKGQFQAPTFTQLFEQHKQPIFASPPPLEVPFDAR